jgi:hypothetical protein
MISGHWKIAALAATTTAAALIAYAGDVGVKLNVKLGLWEVTTSGKTGDIPEQMLAQIPPERRAQMIAAIKASANRTRTYRQCMTAEKLAKGFDVQPTREGCASSARALRARRTSRRISTPTAVKASPAPSPRSLHAAARR